MLHMIDIELVVEWNAESSSGSFGVAISACVVANNHRQPKQIVDGISDRFKNLFDLRHFFVIARYWDLFDAICS